MAADSVAGVGAFPVKGVELPYGDDPVSWQVPRASKGPSETELLPGRYFALGLVDSHAHPAIGFGQSGLTSLQFPEIESVLQNWARDGIALIRDVGSRGGATLQVTQRPGRPAVRAAGRFLAPAGRYFAELLDRPTDEADLTDAGLEELARGAGWVKVIADFPDLAAGTEAEPTYRVEAVAALTEAVHQAGGRVAVHSTVANVAALVQAGVDSIEHGMALDEQVLADMAARGTAWVPTLSAMVALETADYVPDARRAAVREARSRLTELLPLAVRLGVPVLAGTDVSGTVAGEVALLAQLGLDPKDALATATVWPRKFLGTPTSSTDAVTYHEDPRDDPEQLRSPAAVVIGGVRVR